MNRKETTTMQTRRAGRRARGFTLLELLIVIAVIVVIAAAALPNLLSSRLTANEAAAISTLRTIVSAQAQAQSRGAADTDGDGIGEYLYLAELSGTTNLRGMGVPLSPAAVSVALGQVNNTVVNKSGYLFAMFLPGPGGAGVGEDANGGKAVPAAVDADFAETVWACYAWPATFGSSGRRAFMVSQSGDILQSDNVIQTYSGLAAPPAPDAAYSAPADMTAPLSIAGAPAPAQDGGNWLSVN